MLVLALDTATPLGSVAILKDCHVLGVIGTKTDEAFSSRLFRQLDFLLGELAVSLKDVDVFSAGIGPGSFTGLRVGLAAVKGWAEAFERPVAAVSGLEAIASLAGTSSSRIVPVMDARRGQVYAALYRRGEGGLVLEGGEQVISPAELLDRVSPIASDEGVAVVTPHYEVVAKMLRGSVFPPHRLQEVPGYLAPAIGRLGYERAMRGELLDALQLDANYIRRPDAELLWKGR